MVVEVAKPGAMSVRLGYQGAGYRQAINRWRKRRTRVFGGESAPPGPASIGVLRAQPGDVALEHRVHRKRLDVLINGGSQRLSNRLRHQHRGRLISQRGRECCRARCLARSVHQQLPDQGLIVMDENGAVLEQRTIPSPLSASHELSAVHDDLVFRRHVEAWSRSGRNRRGMQCRPGRDTQVTESEEQDAIDEDVSSAGGRRIGDRQSRAVGHFPVVQQRATSGWPPDEADAKFSRPLFVIAGSGTLIPAE